MVQVEVGEPAADEGVGLGLERDRGVEIHDRFVVVPAEIVGQTAIVVGGVEVAGLLRTRLDPGGAARDLRLARDATDRGAIAKAPLLGGVCRHASGRPEKTGGGSGENYRASHGAPKTLDSTYHRLARQGD